MSNYEYRTATPEEVWPDHAGHTILYITHGMTAAHVKELEVENWGDEYGTQQVYALETEQDDHLSEVRDTVFVCRTCHVELETSWDSGDFA